MEYGSSNNSGIEISEEHCQKLSEIISDKLDSGLIKRYEIKVDELSRSLKEDCYYFPEEKVRLFNDFLKRCGGFDIW